jgi:hypothetical protein
VAETAVVTLLDEIRLVVIAAGVALTVRTIPAAAAAKKIHMSVPGNSTYILRGKSEENEKYSNRWPNHRAHQYR